LESWQITSAALYVAFFLHNTKLISYSLFCPAQILAGFTYRIGKSFLSYVHYTTGATVPSKNIGDEIIVSIIFSQTKMKMEELEEEESHPQLT
jgi:hypothetical protein